MTYQHTKANAEGAAQAQLAVLCGTGREAIPHVKRARDKQRERTVIEDILFEIQKAA